MVKEMKFNPFLSPTEAVVTASIYNGIFLFVAYRLMMKRDL